MNIQEILAKMDSNKLAEGLKQLSKGLSPEQLKTAENIIKDSGISKELNMSDAGSLQSQLLSNPQQIKALVQNKELIAKLEALIKKK